MTRISFFFFFFDCRIQLSLSVYMYHDPQLLFFCVCAYFCHVYATVVYIILLMLNINLCSSGELCTPSDDLRMRFTDVCRRVFSFQRGLWHLLACSWMCVHLLLGTTTPAEYKLCVSIDSFQSLSSAYLDCLSSLDCVVHACMQNWSQMYNPMYMYIYMYMYVLVLD